MLSNCRARRGNPPFLPFFDDCNVINSDNRNELLSHLGTIHLRYGTGFQRSTLSSNAGLGRSSRSRDGLPIKMKPAIRSCARPKALRTASELEGQPVSQPPTNHIALAAEIGRAARRERWFQY